MARGNVEVVGPQSQRKEKDEFVHGHEFFVGQMVSLSGNQFFIYDADDFTRNYFADGLGVQLEEKKDVELPTRGVPRAPTPPYNGYGSWDDSMASVTHLIPKAPKKDLVKLFNNEGKVLRFTARFANARPEDEKRIFIFNFDLSNDTLSIHEPPQRNLGIVTGRFLEKSVHVNGETGALVKQEDLKPGKVVSLYDHRFEMIDMDEYTRKMMEDPNAEIRKFDLNAVLQKIRESLRQQFAHVRDVFRRFDLDHNGVLTVDEFKAAFKKFGFNLTDREIMVVMNYFNRRGDGQVSYNEFCDMVLDEDYTTDMLKSKPNLKTELESSYAQQTSTKKGDRQETADVRKAVRDLGEKVYQRHGTLHKLFKEFEKMTYDNVVSDVDIQTALKAIGLTFKLEDIDRVILYVKPNSDLKRVGYVDFFKNLMAGYHDMSAVR
jgi:Ca2+-binding EF-hand superfamily protein